MITLLMTICWYRGGISGHKEHISAQPNFDLQSYWEEERRFLDVHKQSITLLLHITPQARYNLRGEHIVLQEERDGSALIQAELESIEAAAFYTLSFMLSRSLIIRYLWCDSCGIK
ncbi:hypothetical protein KSF_110940 [Reticulibacter mediterranei]|uniref:Uncharacterized protein n=1 Tax=Reticulibacter mediterranei TaxID=2778369 RepID=A0A8J3J5F4_9CHLR|nr:hypothetical protein [Reticulibacter mediterranei]GHP01047.1 hypothetical protein KSF_110940 [Reticulibacter mediterranei]